MKTTADYFKSLGITLLVSVIMLVVTGAFNFPEKVYAKIDKVEIDAKAYTDKRVHEHELNEAARDEMLIKYLDQRFDDQAKLIENTDRSNFGLLYNGYATTDVNFLPVYWNIPSISEWNTLFAYAVDPAASLRKIGTDFWNLGGYTDLYGFSAIGSGYRSNDGAYIQFKEWAYMANSYSIDTGVYITPGGTNSEYPLAAETGASVRAIWRGTGTPAATITDKNGNVYDVVQIGTQYWLKQNWKCTKLNNGTSIPLVTNSTSWAALTTKGYCYPNGDVNNV